MPSQNDNGGRRGPWGGAAKPGTDLEDLVRQGQDRVRQIMPTGRPRSTIVLVILALAAIVAWTTYYTVPSDSVAVVQRFGKYLKDVPPGLHFKLPLGIDVATIVPVKRQLKQEFGFATPGATDPYQIPRDAKTLSVASNAQKERTFKCHRRTATGTGAASGAAGQHPIPISRLWSDRARIDSSRFCRAVAAQQSSSPSWHWLASSHGRPITLYPATLSPSCNVSESI